MFMVLINCITVGTSSWHILRASKATECPWFLQMQEYVTQGNRGTSTKINLDAYFFFFSTILTYYNLKNTHTVRMSSLTGFFIPPTIRLPKNNHSHKKQANKPNLSFM